MLILTHNSIRPTWHVCFYVQLLVTYDSSKSMQYALTAIVNRAYFWHIFVPHDYSNLSTVMQACRLLCVLYINASCCASLWALSSHRNLQRRLILHWGALIVYVNHDVISLLLITSSCYFSTFYASASRELSLEERNHRLNTINVTAMLCKQTGSFVPP